MKNNYLVQAWLVLTLALTFGAALAAVEATLAEKIQTNKLDETKSQIPSLVPGATGGQVESIEGLDVYRAVDAAGKQVGWVLPAGGQGFADRIEVLIGLDNQARTITGMYVLSQKETPGLGNKIVEPTWREQFAGKTTAVPLSVTKNQNASESEIQAVTGATISSQSVTQIVNETVAKIRKSLAAAAR